MKGMNNTASTEAIESILAGAREGKMAILVDKPVLARLHRNLATGISRYRDSAVAWPLRKKWPVSRRDF